MADNAETSTVEVDLSGLSDSELVEFEALTVADYKSKRSAESFTLEDTKELDSLLAAITAARAEMKSREAQAVNDSLVDDVAGSDFLAKINAAKAAAAAKAEPVVTETAPVVEPVAEVVVDPAPVAETVVIAEPAKAEVVITAAGLKGDEPAKIEEVKLSSIVASADIPGFKAGQELDGLKDIAKAFMAKRPAVRGTDPGADGTRFLVASINREYDESRRLDNDIDSTMAKIQAVTSPEALVASGGLCAPLTPLYDIVTYGDAVRPVRDALPAFQATRGGIRFLPPPRLADLAGSTRRTTAAQDAAGYTNQTPPGSTPPKPCLHVTCEAEQTCIIEAVSQCLTFGNFGSRTYPEQVQAWLKLGMVEFARYAETELLNGIQAGSTLQTSGQIYGATGSLLDTVSALVMSFRSRYRISTNFKLRALFPFWIREVFKVDIAAEAPGDGLERYNISDAQLDAWFASRGVNISWYQDNTTSEGAPWPEPIPGGGVRSWPNRVEWFLFPEGAWVYLDGGTLDLGIVRDSTLNSQNDYQVFYEEFFGVCNLGQESYRIISDICPNGTYAPADATLRACLSPAS